ncbi:MAG: hypothetical protein GXP28_00770 [Planctomycetes bacterium]|nr:hypothetical protein [Planctomycetota bacterium]
MSQADGAPTSDPPDPSGGDATYANKYTEALLDHRKLLLETAQSRADLFDKSLIAIATGTMALSVTFIRFIAPAPVSIWLLFASWGAFTLSLLLTMLTLQLTQHGIDHELESLDKDLRGEDSAANNPFSKVTTILSWASFAVLLIGLWCFAFFALANVGNNNNGEKEKDSDTQATAATDKKKEGRQEVSNKEEKEEDGEEIRNKKENQEEGNDKEKSGQAKKAVKKKARKRR